MGTGSTFSPQARTVIEPLYRANVSVVVVDLLVLWLFTFGLRAIDRSNIERGFAYGSKITTKIIHYNQR